MRAADSQRPTKRPASERFATYLSVFVSDVCYQRLVIIHASDGELFVSHRAVRSIDEIRDHVDSVDLNTRLCCAIVEGGLAVTSDRCVIRCRQIQKRHMISL